MGKSLVRKLVIAAVFAVVIPFVVAGTLAGFTQGLVLANGAEFTVPNLIGAEGSKAWLLIVAIVTFLVSFISAQLVPARRRRQRNSGTIVESDVEDGRERGVVKWFNVKKGFGFITWDEGEDVFVHFRSIRGQGHRSLSEGQRVKFSVVQGDKGPQAEDVSAVR